MKSAFGSILKAGKNTKNQAESQGLQAIQQKRL